MAQSSITKYHTVGGSNRKRLLLIILEGERERDGEREILSHTLDSHACC